jgi:hypothetical protein
MKIWEFAVSPVLWSRAIRDHSRAIKRWKENPPGTPGNKDAADGTWDPFNRTVRYFGPCVIMVAIYTMTLYGMVWLAWMVTK